VCLNSPCRDLLRLTRAVNWLRAWVLAACLAPLWAAAGANAVVEADIRYIAGSSDGAHTLDIHHPGGSLARRLPVLVYVHGGGWGRGNKRLGNSLAPLFVDNGAVFVSLNYRLAPENPYPAFLHDLAAAMRWLKDHVARYGGDPNHIVLTGHSAGAHLVALLATDPQFLERQGLPLNMFRAVVPVDTASFNFLVDPYGWFVERQKKIRRDAFGTDRNVLAAASPTLVVSKARAGSLSPFHIFVSGTRPDAMEQSNAFAEAIRASGNEATVTVIERLGHARMNQAIGDADSPLAKTLLARLGVR
jgi:arylformamidase